MRSSEAFELWVKSSAAASEQEEAPQKISSQGFTSKGKNKRHRQTRGKSPGPLNQLQKSRRKTVLVKLLVSYQVAVMIMTTRVRKPPIRLEELDDELSPHQITGSVPFSDTAFSLLLSCSILASHLSLSRGPQSKQTDYSVPLHQQAIWDLFLEILDWTMGAVFPNHIKNDSQWQSSQQEPFFSPWMNKWNWLHFGWPLLTYYSVWNSLKHHWCQSTFDLTFPSGTPPWEEAFYSYCIHETATYTF